MARLGKDYKGILGAAIGDISGSYIEFNGNLKPKTKEEAVLFVPQCYATDDTVMTVAIADNLRNPGKYTVEESLKHWAKEYPNAGYGTRFLGWVFLGKDLPGDSYGNGSAMRTSPVAYFASSEEEAIEFARKCALPSHGHPEGIKGAVVVTQVIYRALHGASKEELHAFASTQYDFEKLDYEAMKAYTGHGEEICQVTIPQALWAFFHSDSFEDCLRLCHTIGWDADTLAAIACSIAEAYYKEIPDEIVKQAQGFLPKDLREVLESVPTQFLD